MGTRPNLNLRPTIVPILHTKGMIAYARASKSKSALAFPENERGNKKLDHPRSWLGLVTSSPTIVWTTPMFPLSMPPRARPSNAIQKFVAKPTMRRESRVPAQPKSRTGFLPIRSDTLPQNMPVQASAREKAEMRMPA